MGQSISPSANGQINQGMGMQSGQSIGPQNLQQYSAESGGMGGIGNSVAQSILGGTTQDNTGTGMVAGAPAMPALMSGPPGGTASTFQPQQMWSGFSGGTGQNPWTALQGLAQNANGAGGSSLGSGLGAAGFGGAGGSNPSPLQTGASKPGGTQSGSFGG